MSTLGDRSISVPSIVEHYTDAELNVGYHQKTEYEQAIEKYGIIFKVLNFSETDNADLLKKYGREWIRQNYYDGVLSFQVKAVDLRLLGYSKDRLKTGEQIPVEFLDTEPQPVTKTRTCISAQYDLLKPENSTFKVGIPDVSANLKYRESLTKKSSTGGKGGKVPLKEVSQLIFSQMYQTLEEQGIDMGDVPEPEDLHIHDYVFFT